jgi:hypothetical protein
MKKYDTLKFNALKSAALICSLGIALTACSAFQYKNTGEFDDEERPFRNPTTTQKATTTVQTTTEAAVTSEVKTAKPYLPAGKDEDVLLESSGTQFTVVGYDTSAIPILKAWMGEKPDSNPDTLPYETYTGSRINFININQTSGEVVAVYDQMLDGGEDIDVFITESPFLRHFTDDENKAAPMSDIGLDAVDWEYAFPYVQDICTNSEGVLAAASWSAYPGAFYYRADLAQEYLGVNSPEEMQPFVSDWKTMEQTAETIRSKSGGKMVMCDTVEGMIQAYNIRDFYSPPSGTTLNSKALDLMVLTERWYKNGYVGKGTQWMDSWFYGGVDGEIFGYFLTTWTFPYIAGNEGSETQGKWALTEGPSNFFWGGRYLVVNPNTDNGIDCRDFIHSVTIDYSTMRDITSYNNEFVNNSAVMENVGFKTPNTGSQELADVFVDIGNKIANPEDYVYDPNYYSFSQAVIDYASGSANANTALKKFNNREYN